MAGHRRSWNSFRAFRFHSVASHAVPSRHSHVGCLRQPRSLGRGGVFAWSCRGWPRLLLSYGSPQATGVRALPRRASWARCEVPAVDLELLRQGTCWRTGSFAGSRPRGRTAPGIHVALRYQVHCHMPELHTAPTKEKRWGCEKNNNHWPIREQWSHNRTTWPKTSVCCMSVDLAYKHSGKESARRRVPRYSPNYHRECIQCKAWFFRIQARGLCINGRAIHHSHSLAWRRGILFCQTCGAFTVRRVGLLARPCQLKVSSGTTRRYLNGLMDGTKSPLPNGEWPQIDTENMQLHILNGMKSCDISFLL